MVHDQRLFTPTSHTMLEGLQSADQEVRDASVDRFAATYANAIYILGRSRGLKMEDAEDSMQEFMYRMTTLQRIRTYDPSSGVPLSAWLVMCFDSLLSDLRDKRSALKRGGGCQIVRLDTHQAEEIYSKLVPVSTEAATRIDVSAAMSVWEHAQEQLRRHFAGRFPGSLYKDLEPHVLQHEWLPPPAPTQAEVAQRHNTTVTQIKSLLNRNLRRKAEEFFVDKARSSSPGITPTDVSVLWHSLRNMVSAG